MTPNAISQIYASEIVSGFDLHKPQIMNDLYKQYGDQGLGAFMIMRSMGFEKEVSNDTYYHHEENRIHETFKTLNAVVAPGAGNDALITLDPSNLNANNDFYPRLYFSVLFPNGVTGQIMDIDTTVPTAPVLTIRPNQVADDIGALAAGTELVITSSAFSEGSGQPKGAVSGTTIYENDAQIIKETVNMTGTEMVNESWVPVMSDGENIQGYYRKGQSDMDYRLALAIDGALMWQKRTDNPNMIDPSTGRLIKTTEGLIPYMRRKSNLLPYVPGTFNVTDFDEIDRLMDREGAGNYVMSLLGIKLHHLIENTLVDYFKDTNINYARQVVNDALFNKNESLAASVNFKMLTKGERTFMFKRLNSLNNPKYVGADGYDSPDLGLFIPINKRKDPVSKEMISSIGVRYRGLGKYKRRMETWDVNGAGSGLKVTDIDANNTYQRCHMGFHGRGGNQFVLVQP